MRRVIITLVLMATCLVASASLAVAAGKGAPGFSGVAFGTKRSVLASFLTLKTMDHIEYAVNPAEPYRLNGRTPVVFYGFADGRFFAAYVRLDGLISRDDMARRLTADYGKPATTMEGGVEVLRWRRGDLKIKLKADKTSGSLKLAYYSIAHGAAAAMALAEPDFVDFEELTRAFNKDSITKGVTLPAAPRVKGYSPYDDGVSAPVSPSPGK
ncbi:MAG: hypothetical protein AB9872_15990 [Solidesulfovibrio sp.]